MENTMRQKQAQKTQRKIFESAAALFIEKSYENVKVADICKKAGVSIGAFYHYYPSKEALIGTAYRLFDEQIAGMFAVYQSEIPLERAIFLIYCQLMASKARGLHHSVQYFKQQLTIDEKYIIDKSRFFHVQLGSELTLAVAQQALRVSPDLVAQDILVATRGIIYDWCLREAAYDLVPKGLYAAQVVLFYHGLTNNRHFAEQFMQNLPKTYGNILFEALP